MSDIHTSEVLIVGGGVIGLAIARAMRKRGAGRVTVVDRSAPGLEASRAAAGMLAPQAEADSPDAFFRFCRESNELYSRFALELQDETGIDIELDDEGTLFLAFSDEDLVELEARRRWQSESGLRVEKLSTDETKELEPLVSRHTMGSLFFPDDRQVENRILVKALIRFAENNEVEVIADNGINMVEEVRGSAVAISDGGARFEAGTVIVAAGAWTSLIKGADPGAGIPEISPVRGQMIAFRTPRRQFRKVIYSHRGYLVPRRSGRLLAGSTTEHVGFSDRTTDEGVAAIRENAREISPGLAELEVADTWSGLRPCRPGGRPFIGRAPGCERIYAAAGHYRNGILLAPLTAEIVADSAINGVNSEYLDYFGTSPARAGAV